VRGEKEEEKEKEREQAKGLGDLRSVTTHMCRCVVWVRGRDLCMACKK